MDTTLSMMVSIHPGKHIISVKFLFTSNHAYGLSPLSLLPTTTPFLLCTFSRGAADGGAAAINYLIHQSCSNL